MRVLVTGGAGFIGSSLVELLLGEGHDVTVLDDLSVGTQGNLDELAAPVTVVVGTILDPRLVDDLVARADLVFHLAALVGVTNVLASPLKGLRV
ncbi:MAG TPA: NAD-dependent epimerase/dehydratase family protein, partial [Acidimicrobiales bacterium]